MNGLLLFLGKFLRHGTRIASIVPSSVWLARAVTSNINWLSARVIVELGAGTGPITEEILRHAPTECRVIAIERDADFVALLRKRFESATNLEIIHGDALSLASLLTERAIDSVDYIVSGLPVPSFSKSDQQALFTVIGSILRTRGSFNQITEFPLVYKKVYTRFFHDVRFVFEPRNIPPAGAYLCSTIKNSEFVA